MLWIKSLHIIFMVTWFAGLFYLPRLFIYHTMAHDEESNSRFKTMERKLFYGITTPGGLLTLLFGTWLWLGYGFTGMWLYLKLVLVTLLVGYHIWCGKLVSDFRHDNNRYSERFYRWFNEFPVLILVGAILLVVLKPV